MLDELMREPGLVFIAIIFLLAIIMDGKRRKRGGRQRMKIFLLYMSKRKKLCRKFLGRIGGGIGQKPV